MYLSLKLQNYHSSNLNKISEMPIAIFLFISDFEQVCNVCNETSFLKVSQSLQMMEVNVTDFRLLFL